EIVEERVDGEVTADRVLVGIAKDVVATDENIVGRVGRVVVGHLDHFGLGTAAEGRDLDYLASREENMGKAKPPPDDAAIAKERADVFGAGARRDIEVLWLAPEQQVSDTASDEVGLE